MVQTLEMVLLASSLWEDSPSVDLLSGRSDSVGQNDEMGQLLQS